MPPVVHSTGHLFADSRLATAHTSLVALTQGSNRVLREFTSTLFSYARLVVLPGSFLISGLPAKILYAYFLRHIHLSATCPTHLILLLLIWSLNNIRWGICCRYLFIYGPSHIQTFTAMKASSFVGNTAVQIINFLRFLGINPGQLFQTNTIASSNDEQQNTSVNKKVSLVLKSATQYYSLPRHDQSLVTTPRKSNNNKFTHAFRIFD